MEDTLVPGDFEVPTSFEGQGFRLEPLGPEHNDRDHAAWMSSIDHIRSTPGFDSADVSWPISMSPARNLEDLVGHARDFAERKGFTYSILDVDDVIGCLYIYPARQAGHDAKVSSWVSEARAEMDIIVWRAVSDWIDTVWPFFRPYYAGRG